MEILRRHRLGIQVWIKFVEPDCVLARDSLEMESTSEVESICGSSLKHLTSASAGQTFRLTARYPSEDSARINYRFCPC
jgi:hypothetical protein